MDHGTGTVIVNHGARALIEISDGTRLRCSVRGKRLRPVCGDRVDWRRVDAESGVIERIADRRTALERADGPRRTSAIAANLDRVFVVVAPEPEPDAVLIDRYLVMIERGGIEAAIVVNKSDLPPAGFQSRFAEFVRAGYPLYPVSAVNGDGLQSLSAAFSGRASLLAGQSGVGKSSLLNALVPDLALQTGLLSLVSGEGRHTTTATTAYRLDDGGTLVDSPGVREFWLPEMPAPDLIRGFREIARAGEKCRFRDCVHASEPDCAVRVALDTGDIAERRYRSYRTLLRALTGRGS